MGSGATALMRAYTVYHWFHPYGWIIAFGIVWVILLVIFFITGENRQAASDSI